MNLACYNEGREAYLNGFNLWDCPYYHNTNEAESWEDGFIEERRKYA